MKNIISINPNQPPQPPKPGVWQSISKSVSENSVVKTIVENPVSATASGIGSSVAAITARQKTMAARLQQLCEGYKASMDYHHYGKTTYHQAHSHAKNLQLDPDILVTTGAVVRAPTKICGIVPFWDKARYEKEVSEQKEVGYMPPIAEISPMSKSLRFAQERQSGLALPLSNQETFRSNSESQNGMRGGGLASPLSNQKTFRSNSEGQIGMPVCDKPVVNESGTRQLVASVSLAPNATPAGSYSRPSEVVGYVFVIGLSFSFGVLIYGIVGSILNRSRDQKNKEKPLSESEFQQKVLINQEKILKKLESSDNSEIL